MTWLLQALAYIVIGTAAAAIHFYGVIRPSITSLGGHHLPAPMEADISYFLMVGLCWIIIGFVAGRHLPTSIAWSLFSPFIFGPLFFGFDGIAIVIASMLCWYVWLPTSIGAGVLVWAASAVGSWARGDDALSEPPRNPG
jgi:hypothetical protein